MTDYKPAELVKLTYAQLKRHYAQFLFSDGLFTCTWFDRQRDLFDEIYTRTNPIQVTLDLKAIEEEMALGIIEDTPRARWKAQYRLVRLRNATDTQNPNFAQDEVVNGHALTFLGNHPSGAHGRGVYVMPTDTPNNRRIVARMNFYNVLNTIWANLPDYRVPWNEQILKFDRLESQDEGFKLP